MIARGYTFSHFQIFSNHEINFNNLVTTPKNNDQRFENMIFIIYQQNINIKQILYKKTFFFERIYMKLKI